VEKNEEIEIEIDRVFAVLHIVSWIIAVGMILYFLFVKPAKAETFNCTFVNNSTLTCDLEIPTYNDTYLIGNITELQTQLDEVNESLQKLKSEIKNMWIIANATNWTDLYVNTKINFESCTKEFQKLSNRTNYLETQIQTFRNNLSAYKEKFDLCMELKSDLEDERTKLYKQLQETNTMGWYRALGISTILLGIVWYFKIRKPETGIESRTGIAKPRGEIPYDISEIEKDVRISKLTSQIEELSKKIENMERRKKRRR
jgi:chaperonin cofactor prefoldin